MIEIVGQLLKSLKEGLDGALLAADRHFDSWMSPAIFPIFCLCYIICFFLFIRYVNRKDFYRPSRKSFLQRIGGFLRGEKKGEVSALQKYKALVDEDKTMVWDEKKCDRLPQAGMTEKTIHEKVDRWMKKEQANDPHGKCLGGIFTRDANHNERMNQFAQIYMYQNPLHLDSYKELSRMEAEVLKMSGHLITNKSNRVYGVITSGTTESLVMAIYSYRQFYSNRKRPNLVVPDSANLAIDKGGFLLNVEVRKAKLNERYEVDLAHMEKLIDEETILLICSYPSYTYGLVDPVKEIAALALKYHTGMHIDACLGGFVAAFSKEHTSKLSLDIEGVTSVSLNQHKYGEAPKGVSSMFFKTPELRHCMYYISTEWMGGVYGTNSFPGSRSGFFSAGAWYSLTNVGRSHYINNAKQIIHTTKKVVADLRKIPEVDVIGDPELCCFVFTTAEVFWVDVAAELKKKGWMLSSVCLQNGIHVTVTPYNREILEGRLVNDVRSCVDILRKMKR